MHHYYVMALHGTFDRTIVLLASDHGFHYSSQQWFNNFIQGEYQHRNPFLKIVVPKALKHLVKHEVALGNAHRFVSHLDLHATLLKWTNNFDPEHFSKFTAVTRTQQRVAYDLLTEAIPQDRTCKDAGVPRQWCNCFKERNGIDCEIDTKDGCSRPGTDVQSMMKKFTAVDKLSS